jgi:hypothetical protein
MTKEKILQFIEYNGIKKRDFLEKTGIKRGFLDKDKLNQAVSDEHFAKIIAEFPELSLDWLITGKGAMLRDTNARVAAAEEEPPPVARAQGPTEREALLMELLEKRDKEITSLNRRIWELERHEKNSGERDVGAGAEFDNAAAQDWYVPQPEVPELPPHMPAAVAQRTEKRL